MVQIIDKLKIGYTTCAIAFCGLKDQKYKKMKEILYRLQALYQFYKSAHWLAKGEYFYQDHLLFEKLYVVLI